MTKALHHKHPWSKGCTIHSKYSTLIAENGDELYFEVAEYLTGLDFDCLCKFTGTADVTYTGGTGRFANATGTGTAVLVDDLVTEITSVNMDAIVTY